MRPRHATAFWASALGALGLFDYWCAKNATNGDSLSECARAAFKTHHPIGRAVFIGTWCGLSAWLVPHICRAVKVEWES